MEGEHALGDDASQPVQIGVVADNLWCVIIKAEITSKQ